MTTETVNEHAVGQSRSTGGLERVSSPDDCCEHCKSGWCNKDGYCIHALPCEFGAGCELAL